MQTADTGAENKDQKGPADSGENKEAPAPGAETVTVPKSELDKLTSTIAQAENRIVGLKKELETAKKSGDGIVETDVKVEIEALKTEIEGLKNFLAQKEDKTLEELQAARSKITELSKAVIHQKTTTNDSSGSGQSPEVKPAVEPLAKTPQEKEIMERVKQRRISQGRDPETGKYK